ncbi:MAG TPA: FAD-binding and (Fe-S)-binding domain-containing protein [Anaerolineales bacterium]|nr:FAD-binding and (Fe-S)-binding domain-containing protein [Anaerolineales bacterium]
MKRASAEALREFQAFAEGAARLEARFDAFTRALFSTDASNHQVEPLGVVFPRSAEEVAAVVAKAAELGLPLLPRGSGTSLGGQAVGACLILDLSRHMNRIGSIDVEHESALVEPGVVCARFNAEAGRVGYAFGPDPASADRATFGGMIGNNAAGAHSIRYGTTADHVLAAEVVLSDGSTARLEALEPAAAARIGSGASLEASIYRTALDLRQSARSAVERSWPRTWRRASGYSLNYLVGYSPAEPPGWYRPGEPYLRGEQVNLAPVLSGSEGTLAILTRATVRLVRRPTATVLALIACSGIAAACDLTPGILETEPSAVELIPKSILERARSVPAYARMLTFLDGEVEALLVVEYTGETAAEARSAAQRLRMPVQLLETPQSQADLWAVRRVGLGLLMSVPGDVKPVTFIEDVAVPVERLGEYVRRVDEILRAHGTRGEWYAHASAGCLHLRPLLNLKTVEGRAELRGISEAVFSVVRDMRGSFSGEHGDGLSHTEFNAALFGPELMAAFRRLKDAFDPDHRLNPGKVVPLEDAPVAAVDRDLRYDSRFPNRDVPAIFAHRREGSLIQAIEACNGAGVCRKDDGLMCPSYQATRLEEHSTRGRANALRAALTGRLPSEAWASPQLHGILDLCLECKGCKAECPTAVDMARLKAEFLAAYQKTHGVPLRSRLFGEIGVLLRLSRPVAPLVNRLSSTRLLRSLQDSVLGIDRRRRLPRLARDRFRAPVRRQPRLDSREVVLFVDTFTELSNPETARAAQRLLNASGYDVVLAAGQTCCGRPMISKGLLDRARQMARRNVDALAPFAARGVPIVGLEPSCLLTLRDEYLEFFPRDPQAQSVANSARLLEEFLTDADGGTQAPLQRLAFRVGSPNVLLHNHCHAKALIGSAALRQVLSATGARVEEIDSGCCGMAGSFGYEKEHYDLSMRIGGMKLFPRARGGVGQGVILVAPGMSCRTQIEDGVGAAAVHPADFLASRLQDAPAGRPDFA